MRFLIALIDRRLAFNVAEGVLQVCLLVDNVLPFFIVDDICNLLWDHLSIIAHRGFVGLHSQELTLIAFHYSGILLLHASPDCPERLEIDHSRTLARTTISVVCEHRLSHHFLCRPHILVEHHNLLVQEHI